MLIVLTPCPKCPNRGMARMSTMSDVEWRKKHHNEWDEWEECEDCGYKTKKKRIKITSASTPKGQIKTCKKCHSLMSKGDCIRCKLGKTHEYLTEAEIAKGQEGKKYIPKEDCWDCHGLPEGEVALGHDHRKTTPPREEFGEIMKTLFIPYRFHEDGFEWTLLSAVNDFSRSLDDTLDWVEYENQYGHLRKMKPEEIKVFLQKALRSVRQEAIEEARYQAYEHGCDQRVLDAISELLNQSTK